MRTSCTQKSDYFLPIVTQSNAFHNIITLSLKLYFYSDDLASMCVTVETCSTMKIQKGIFGNKNFLMRNFMFGSLQYFFAVHFRQIVDRNRTRCDNWRIQVKKKRKKEDFATISLCQTLLSQAKITHYSVDKMHTETKLLRQKKTRTRQNKSDEKNTPTKEERSFFRWKKANKFLCNKNANARNRLRFHCLHSTNKIYCIFFLRSVLISCFPFYLFIFVFLFRSFSRRLSRTLYRLLLCVEYLNFESTRTCVGCLSCSFLQLLITLR